ncbi:MAG: threonine-phosphate decarboxylase [Hyphomicrobiales bacterium]|nr:threonine-phosphate decarboxylase [Hyphomicrobiales bacterium]MBV9428149.1 threonine-phosphate decarboxylase [Bradyrhizobiaceae bacterium]
MAADPGDWAIAPLDHGGDLTSARSLFPGAPEPLIDLSTGINPSPYPVQPLDLEAFTRLPEQSALKRLCQVAARAYAARSAGHVVAAPGAQMLLPLVAALVPPGRAVVLGPTYSEHARAAALAGHSATETAEVAQLADADLAIVVNPNNPDGRVVPAQRLRALADTLTKRRGLLVVDEAFMDVGPADASMSDTARNGLVVLRSFGKFFGLAGLRLGFAIAAPEQAARLRAQLGPWPLSGAAIAIGSLALADTAWIEATRRAVSLAAQRLDALLLGARLEIVGGTALFRLVRTNSASMVFERLGRAGIVVRRFRSAPTWLRFGLPDSETAWERLRVALGEL